MKRKITIIIFSFLFYQNVSSQTPCTSNGLPLSLQTGLEGYYPFCNNADDKSGNNRNGTVHGATLTTDRFGAANSAYLFNGSNNYISLGSSFDLLPRSICFWFNTSLIDLSNRFVYCSDNPGLVNGLTNFGVLKNANVDSWWSTISTVNRFAPITQNAWHFGVIIVDSNVTRKYIDGQLLFTDSIFSFYSSIFGSDTAEIGTSRYTTDGFFQGKIDDIMIYNRVLSQNDITVLNNNTLAITSPPNQNNFNLYPNPTAAEVTIDFGTITRSTIQLFNMFGEMLEEKQENAASLLLYLDDKPNGIYFISITTDNGAFTRKLTVCK